MVYKNKEERIQKKVYIYNSFLIFIYKYIYISILQRYIDNISLMNLWERYTRDS